MNITAFLNSNFKPIMKWYYMRKYRKDIYNMLTLHITYGSIPMDQVVSIMSCDYGGDIMKDGKIWGICVYCGLLENAK
jgi:hypothetical protein